MRIRETKEIIRDVERNRSHFASDVKAVTRAVVERGMFLLGLQAAKLIAGQFRRKSSSTQLADQEVEAPTPRRAPYGAMGVALLSGATIALIVRFAQQRRAA